MGRSVLFVIGVLASAGSACAAAWTQKAGEGFLAVNAFYYHTSESFDQDGDTGATDPFTKYELNPYIEYGWDEEVTLGASLFLQALSQTSNATGIEQENYGIAESELFARWKFYEEGGYVTSLQPLIKLPSVYSDEDSVKAGRPQMDVELSWLNGYGFEWAGEQHYLMGDIAYRRRLGMLEDQLKLHAGAGFGVSEDWTVLPQLYMTFPVGASASNLVSVSGQNDYYLTKLQLSAVYDVNATTAVEFGGFRHVDGKSTGEGGGFLLSVWKRW